MNVAAKNRGPALVGLRVSVLAAAVCTLFGAPAAQAQSCALCYTSVAGGGPAAIRAFQIGILSLLIPTLLLFSSIFFLIYRRARAATQEQSQVPMAQPTRVPRFAAAPSRLPLHGSLPTPAS